MRDFDLNEALDAMASASTMDAMTDLLLELRDAHGLANLVYHAASLPGCEIPNPILVLSYDPQWIDQYLTQNYFEIDPVVAGAVKGFLPFDWSTVDRSRSSVKHFFKEADKFGVGRQGVTIPIRGPNGERAHLTATCNVTDDEWIKRRVQYMRDYHALAHFFHDHAVRLSGLRVAPPAQLSRREQQCIQMAALGHQQKNIAYELGISERAVRLYTNSARHKLRCATLAETVAKAMRLELIEA